jgi:hypothetical protein
MMSELLQRRLIQGRDRGAAKRLNKIAQGSSPGFSRRGKRPESGGRCYGFKELLF